MARDSHYTPKPQSRMTEIMAETAPFDSAVEAWFWFIQAQQARIDGARFTRGAGLIARPCEPIDVLNALDRLYRARKLQMDHLLVLRHYGRRMLPPDPRRPKELRAWKLWTEALGKLSGPLEEKGIVRPAGAFAPWLAAMNVVQLDMYREAAE